MQCRSCFGISLLSIFFILTSSVLLALDNFCPMLTVVSEVNDFQYYKINSYFFQIAYLFNKMYCLKSSKYTLDVNIDDKITSPIIKNGKNLKNISISTNQKCLFADQNFEKQLICSMIFAENSIPINIHNSSGIDWIILGTLRELNSQKNFSLAYFGFPIMARIIQNKGRIDCRKIINFDVKEDGMVHNYFAEESQILLDAILKKEKGKEFLFEYVKKLQVLSNDAKERLLAKLLEKYRTTFDLPKGNPLVLFNLYLNKMAYDLAVNSHDSFSTDKTINGYLYDVEKKKSNIGGKYYLYLQELEKQNARAARVWPELQVFLDDSYPNSIK